MRTCRANGDPIVPAPADISVGERLLGAGAALWFRGLLHIHYGVPSIARVH